MSAALYQEALKTLAKAAHGAGRLDGAEVSLRLDNPLCGDRIDLYLRLAQGRIVALAHETRGCLLCQAAASLVGLRAPDCDVVTIESAVQALEGRLAGKPDAREWPEMEIFAPVANHRNRHGCVTLPFRALSQALRQAMQQVT